MFSGMVVDTADILGIRCRRVTIHTAFETHWPYSQSFALCVKINEMLRVIEA